MKKHPEGYSNWMEDSSKWHIGGAIDINGRADGAAFTVEDPSGSNRDVTIQLQDAHGVDVDFVQSVELHVFADAAGLDWAVTGGTTGIVDNGDGSILSVVAKKIFAARSTATGSIQVRWTDTVSEVAFLGVKLPSGRVVIATTALTI